MADALATYSRAELIGQLNVEKSQLREIRLLGKTDDNELKATREEIMNQRARYKMQPMVIRLCYSHT